MKSERRLWLVRHGETEGQSSIRYHGANDVALSDVGRQQIRALLPLLAGVPFAQVVHSPLSRAAESTSILVDGLRASGVAIDVDSLRADERLREISFGACEGMTREEIDAAFPTFWADQEAGKTDRFPDGELRTDFAARVSAAVAEVAASEWRGDALLVAHRGIVRQAIVSLLGDPKAPRDAYAVELASLSVLRQTGAGWELEQLGTTGS
ncbi:MAG: broad specificity phosphatase PhoE [Planctomycetota bacterium]|jgi:broad specificity phosphatase PhoE